jgi:hypothetical protein
VVEQGEQAGLAERIKRGGYVVDPEAVAEAIIRRWQSGWSLMFVPPEAGDGSAVEADENETAAGADLA